MTAEFQTKQSTRKSNSAKNVQQCVSSTVSHNNAGMRETDGKDSWRQSK